mgnify:CR=1 FL=1
MRGRWPFCYYPAYKLITVCSCSYLLSSITLAGTITQPAQTLSADSDGWSAHVPAVPKNDRDTWALLLVIAQRYGGFSGPQLSAITHKAGGAWARVSPPDGSVITHEQMKSDAAVFGGK